MAKMTKAQRWRKAIAQLQTAFQELVKIQEEYGNSLDNLPNGLRESPTADVMEDVINIDLSDLEDAIDEIVETAGSLPLGGGRD